MKDPNAENANYSEATWHSKNVYLSFIVIEDCENIFYTFYAQQNVKNVFNSVMVWDNSENVFSSSAVIKGYNIFYSRYIVNSNNIWFSSNLIGCSECIFCDGLENKKYFINNKEYLKDDYYKEKENILRQKDKFEYYYSNVNKRGKNLGSDNAKGQFCVYSQNVENAYFCYRLQNARNAMFVGHENGRKNVLDTICSDEASPGDIYACSNLGESQNAYFCDAFIGSNVYYCFNLVRCSYCIGCIGLKNKSYCILNKQYEKDDWYELANKIFEQMDRDSLLGNSFPGSLNPFYFNDTLAYLIDDSFSKEEVEKEGYMWRDEKIKVDIPDGADIVYTTPPARSSLPPHLRGAKGELLLLSDYQGYDSDGNWYINPNILKKVIIDSKGDYYKIIKSEFDFLIKYSLPLPHNHWLDRIKDGLNFEK